MPTALEVQNLHLKTKTYLKAWQNLKTLCIFDGVLSLPEFDVKITSFGYSESPAFVTVGPIDVPFEVYKALVDKDMLRIHLLSYLDELLEELQAAGVTFETTHRTV